MLLILWFVVPSVFADASIFLYHRFGEDRHSSTNVRIEQFESHLQLLADEQFQVWPLKCIVDALQGGRTVPHNVVAITVDDAYLSVYQEAYPRLKARGWPFTVFVSTEPVDQKLKGFMTWDQMREMSRNGVTFANHGVTHRHLLKRLSGEALKAWQVRMLWEIETAQKRLRDELGVTVKFFAYPFGEFDESLANLVAAEGYIGFGQQSGPVGVHADFRALPRFPFSEAYAGLTAFRQKARTVELPVVKVDPWNPKLLGAQIPRLTLTLERQIKRASEIRCHVTGQGLAKIDWLRDDFTELTVEARKTLPLGRSRYNCTVPAGGGRYHWYSHLWITMEQ